MGVFGNILNGIVDIVKLVIIALVCLVVILIGGYLLADLVGLIPEATGYYRPLTVQMFLTDMPFIGGNMIYLIVAMVLLVLVAAGIEIYGRKQKDGQTDVQKADEKPPATPPANGQ